MGATIPFMFILLFLFPLVARADWQAHFSVKSETESKKLTTSEGTMSAQGVWNRLELTTPIPLIIIVNTQSHEGITLIPAAKMYSKAKLSDNQMRDLGICASGKADDCLTKYGFKKTGTAKQNGYACDIYESSLGPPKASKPTDLTTWRPAQFKEVPLTRLLIQEKPGTRTELNLTNIQTKGLSKSLFEIPKGYNELPLALSEALMKNLGK